MTYNLQLNKAIEQIKESKAKLVLIQLPDGLKPKAAEIEESITKNTDAKVLIWLGSCFGACDIPLEVERLGVDLIINWGHSQFIKEW